MEEDYKKGHAVNLTPDDVKAYHACEHPVGEIEEALERIWSEILRIEKVGRNDNFFELGGNSLQAARIINSIYEVFGMELPIRTIFELQTIKALSRKIEDTYNEVLGEDMDEGVI